jgi:uncharacterized membrane protein YsdA (DUF1294 family)
MEQAIVYLILAYLVVMSLIGFILMGVDKRRAIKGAWRIPERTLILQAFLGGGLGTLIAMYAFRHKTKHTKFGFFVPLAALIYLAVIAKVTGIY